jgi:hypothetical protein
MTPEQETRRKAIMYQLDDYHDRQYRGNPPSYMLIAALAGLGWVIAVADIAWIVG